jgi:hypothetical protein
LLPRGGQDTQKMSVSPSVADGNMGRLLRWVSSGKERCAGFSD